MPQSVHFNGKIRYLGITRTGHLDVQNIDGIVSSDVRLLIEWTKEDYLLSDNEKTPTEVIDGMCPTCEFTDEIGKLLTSTTGFTSIPALHTSFKNQT
ncbi:hypothetical protein L596_029682 [Steinernema carpocapsae]|uniref:Uncharacterized protein n=1 Tax=Steinernema carpocapsae TaxID=34508 RepID=A0A4U5LQD0_STECR|nr:hypothetical protein L596_029682 [Steinernema carpocapsae]